MTAPLKEVPMATNGAYISDVEISDAATIYGKYHAVMGSSVSYVGVWAGRKAVSAPIAIAPAPVTDGVFRLAGVGSGVNFGIGEYTIAYIVDIGLRYHAICGTLLLSHGKPIEVQHTRVAVVGQSSSAGETYVTISYSMPDGNTPCLNSDALCVFTGDQVVVPGAGDQVGFGVFDSDAVTGKVNVPISSPMVHGRKYIIEYAPANQVLVSAYNTFIWTL
ncbi:hypothetical protein [Paraherbaspirillum soli]|uniref:Uncharacterized protein n=1 Tax=Paraherbaspirillum soli TaxID=631222 RepID=A0ABW0M7Z4_9BURK